MSSRPALIVVSGPPAAGKTTLAHRLARAIGCPAICRDEIKEGMALAAAPGFAAGPGDPLTVATLPVFFRVLEVLLAAGVTTVAEAAFQDRVWRPRLEPLLSLAQVRVVECAVDAAVARERKLRRAAEDPHRAAHGDPPPADPAEHARAHDAFARISLAVPSIRVNTTDGYRPALADIARFAQDR